MHALNGNQAKRKLPSSEDAQNEESITSKKVRDPRPAALGIKQTLAKYNDQEIHNVWSNLEDKKCSPNDTAMPIQWDDLHTTTDANGDTRYCWGVNRVAYGYGFRDSDRARVVDLALMSKLHTTTDVQEKEALRKSLMMIGKGKKKSDLLGAHLCGRGRRKGHDKAGKYCVNPTHIVPRTYKVNDEQVHCHYFLHKADDEQRQKFYDGNFCNHDPPCF